MRIILAFALSILCAAPAWAQTTGFSSRGFGAPPSTEQSIADLANFDASAADPGPGNDAAFARAFDALHGRGIVWVTPTAGCYRVTQSIKPPFGISLEGAGYHSCIETPPEGWAITYGGDRDYALIVINHEGRTAIRNLRLRGSLMCPPDSGGREFCPALISFNTVSDPRLLIEGVVLEGLILQDTKHNAIHPNWITGSMRGFRIVGNTCEHVGLNQPGGDAKTGFCIEATMESSIIAQNIVRNSWGGIAVYGAHNVVSGNVLECVASNRAQDTQYCLYGHGEGNPVGGGNVFAGNRVTIRPSAGHILQGIRLDDTQHANLPDTISGNLIVVDDPTATQNGWAIYSTASMGKITGNNVILHGAGIGVLADGREKGSNIEIADTTVRLIGEKAWSAGVYLRNLRKQDSLRAKVTGTQTYGFSAASRPYYYKRDVGVVVVNESGNTKLK